MVEVDAYVEVLREDKKVTYIKSPSKYRINEPLVTWLHAYSFILY